MTVPSNHNKRFLIRTRARSGSTLLTRLLDALSQIHCDADAKPIDGKMHFDPEDLRQRLKWCETLLHDENMVLEDLAPLATQYETDLMHAKSQQQTVDRVCAAVDLPSEQVSVGLNVAAARATVRLGLAQ